MKLVLTAAAALACTLPAAAFAQTAPAQNAAPAPAAAPAPSAAARFTLDTPIEALVADEKAKAVLAADLGGDVTENPSYDQFKTLSFNQVAPFASDKHTVFLPACLP